MQAVVADDLFEYVSAVVAGEAEAVQVAGVHAHQQGEYLGLARRKHISVRRRFGDEYPFEQVEEAPFGILLHVRLEA